MNLKDCLPKLKVMSKMCEECLFTKNKVVDEKAKEKIIKDALAEDSHFTCHKFTIAGEDGVCKGFYDNHSTNFIRVAGRMGLIEHVNPDDYPGIKEAAMRVAK